MLIRPATLFAHFVAQAAAVLWWYVTPTWWRAIFAADFPVLLPVFAHLLAHLAPLIRRQVAPITLSPCIANRAKQAQKQDGKGKATFHGLELS